MKRGIRQVMVAGLHQTSRTECAKTRKQNVKGVIDQLFSKA